MGLGGRGMEGGWLLLPFASFATILGALRDYCYYMRLRVISNVQKIWFALFRPLTRWSPTRCASAVILWPE